jgi:type IV fimbrial biogenesis protein FimT
LTRGLTRGRTRGFTLVELLVVMAIAAILLTIAVPSYQSTITTYRISTEVNALVGDLQYARSEAVKQGMTVTVCASADALTCSGGTNWNAGYIVLTNPNNSLTPSTPTSTILRVQRTFSGTDTITGGTAAVSFNRDGFAGLPQGSWNAFAALAQPVTLAVRSTPVVANVGSCAVISNIGQISVLGAGKTSNTAATTPVTC